MSNPLDKSMLEQIAEALGLPKGTDPIVWSVPDEQELYGEPNTQPSSTGELTIKIIKAE